VQHSVSRASSSDSSRAYCCVLEYACSSKQQNQKQWQ
jgi:hypothetical protein